MSIPGEIRSQLRLPVICPPMFLVSGPDLVREACLAGLVGVLPRQNARSFEIFAGWMRSIREAMDEATDRGETVGPLGVNVSAKIESAELNPILDVCDRAGARIVVSAYGDPAELVQRVHDRGGIVYHDVTSLRFAEKAIAAGVDGLICIGAGGGGHSGTVSHLAFLPKVRSMFDGTIIAAGAIATGAAVRAAEILGADLCYAGTRFIATQESLAAPAYKEMLVQSRAADLHYLPAENGVPANWLGPALTAAGIDVSTLERARRQGRPEPLPAELRYWVDVWSAGQGVELIADVPTVHDLARRMRQEYVDACRTPDMSEVARLVEQATA
jgi:nitronate monooxygenase